MARFMDVNLQYFCHICITGVLVIMTLKVRRLLRCLWKILPPSLRDYSLASCGALSDKSTFTFYLSILKKVQYMYQLVNQPNFSNANMQHNV